MFLYVLLFWYGDGLDVVVVMFKRVAWVGQMIGRLES
jgi:hypothetical protein